MGYYYSSEMSEHLYVSLRDDGNYGLFAKVPIFKGECIIDIKAGVDMPERDYQTIETDEGHFLHMEGKFANHSCDPSATVDKANGKLIAIRDILSTEEITLGS